MAERLNPALEFLEECRKVRHHPDAKVDEAIGVLVAVGNQEAINSHRLSGFEVVCRVADEKYFVGVCDRSAR